VVAVGVVVLARRVEGAGAGHGDCWGRDQAQVDG
jgi:hypothetical protein